MNHTSPLRYGSSFQQLFALLTVTIFVLLPEISILAQTPDTLSIRREIDSLLNIGDKLQKSQQFDLAIANSTAARDKAALYLGKRSMEYGSCLNQMGSICTIRGMHKEAEPLFVESLDILKALKGSNNHLYAARVTNLGAVLKALGRYGESENRYLESIRIYEADSTLNRIGYSNSLNNLANLYIQLNRYNEAETLLNQALLLREQYLGIESEEYASTIENLGNLKKNSGEYRKAVDLYNLGLQIRERKSGKNTLSYARTLNNLANTYRELNEFDSAELLLGEANRIRVSLNGKNNTHYTRGISSMAHLMSETGRYDEALDYYREALEIETGLLGKDHPSCTNTMHNMAVQYRIRGEYVQAEELYLHVMELQARSPGKETTEYSNTLANLGFLYHLIGQKEACLKYLNEAMNIRLRVLGANHSKYGESLTDIATVLTFYGQYERAEHLFSQGLPVIAGQLGQNSNEYNFRLMNYSVLLLKMHKPDTALTILLDIRKKLYSDGRTDAIYPGLLADIGMALLDLNKREEARSYFELAVQAASSFFDNKHPLYLNNVKLLGRYYATTGDLDEAADLFVEASKAEQEHLMTAADYLTESELFGYMKQFEINCEQFYSLAQTMTNPSEALLGEAFNRVLSNKNILADIVRKRGLLAVADSSMQLSKKMKILRGLIQKEMGKPVVERDSLHINEWQIQSDQIEKKLVRTVSGYGDMINRTDWQAVKNSLGEDEAAVEFVNYRFSVAKRSDSVMYAALVLLPSESVPRFIPLFEENALKALYDRPGFDESLIIKSLYSPDSGLRQLVWAPLEPLLKQVKTIYYSPAGMLYRINPAAIKVDREATLSDRYSWVRMGSTRELAGRHLANQSYARRNDDGTPQTAMVWGGINYDMDSLSFVATNYRPEMKTEPANDGALKFNIGEYPYSRSTANRSGGDSFWEPLPGASLEAKEVNQLLINAGFNSTILENYQACEENFKAIGTREKSPDILHIATHGFALPKPAETGIADIYPTDKPVYTLLNDPMMRCGLLLAGANHFWMQGKPLGNYENGVLTANEVRDMNLQNTELAVLSACQTGLGDVMGSEGVYGMERAFHIAGVRFLIVSLWYIPDGQTRELMNLFYENWTVKGESLRDAFSHAQTTMRKRDPDPNIWAGFVLIE